MAKVKTLQYVRPRSLSETLDVLNTTEDVYIVSGATDFIPRMRRPGACPKVAVDIGALKKDLGNIRMENGDLHIGSMATHTEICASPLVKTYAPVLAMACNTVGSRQVRNRGTIGGNICNASPAGDSMPALLILDAEVFLTSKENSRMVKLSEFVTGPSKRDMKQGEILTDIVIRSENLGFKGWYKKMSNRNAVTISLVSAAIAIASDNEIRVAFGAVAPVPVRFPEMEANYTRSGDLKAFLDECEARVSPISDVRASADYRRAMCRNLVIEGLCELGVMKYEEEVQR